MEALNQGRKLYIKCYNYETSLSEDDVTQLKNDIRRFITVSLKEVPLKQLFRNKFILKILQEALEKCSQSGQVGPVMRAFDSVERYIQLLVEQPWKPEYKKLKLYGGFFKTKIQSVLGRAEEIFIEAGYVPSADNQMLVHRGHVDKDRLLMLAFDCHIASVKSQSVSDQYKKLKNIGQSYSDVVSNTFHDSPVIEKTSLGNVAPEKKMINVMGKVPAPSYPVTPGPPALPKREPIVNGGQSNISPYSYESAYGTGLEPGLDDLENHLRPSRSLHQQRKGSGLSNKMDYSPINSPLLQGGPSQEAFPYMDATSEEIIPELPEGTCDDHMRESLKLVNQQADPKPPQPQPTTEDDWKWMRNWQDTAPGINSRGGSGALGKVPMVATPPTSHQMSVQSYPPGMVRNKGVRMGNGMHNTNTPSFDEGIQVDMSSRFPPSSNYLSMGQQVVLPNKPTSQGFHQQMISADQGYSTQSVLHQSNPTPNHIVIQPPTYIDSPTVGSHLLGNHLLQYENPTPQPVPPPIPSRALKPSIGPKAPRTDVGNGMGYVSAGQMQQGVKYGMPQTGAGPAPQMQRLAPEVPVSHPLGSVTEPILRRDRAGKSSSLKYGDSATTAAHKVAQSRVARSMDLTLNQWQCRACTTINTSSDTVCSVCAHSRSNGPGREGTNLCGQTKKACPSCTFENDPSLSYCELCSSKLEDRFTYV